jgi:hypothetical protein
MTPPRRFPFGSEPALPPAPTAPVPPPETAPLGAFVPTASVLPFREAAAPAERTEPVGPLVPPPPRAPARSRGSWRTTAWAVLLLVDLVVLAYLIATWKR